MICGVASVAKKEDIFPVARATYWARLLRLGLLFLRVIGEPGLWVKLGHLFLFLNFYAFNNSSYKTVAVWAKNVSS